MMRDYREDDLKRLKGNSFLRERTAYVKDFESRENYTLEMDGEVMMIMSGPGVLMLDLILDFYSCFILKRVMGEDIIVSA